MLKRLEQLLICERSRPIACYEWCLEEQDWPSGPCTVAKACAFALLALSPEFRSYFH